jgi:hypothetical protein
MMMIPYNMMYMMGLGVLTTPARMPGDSWHTSMTYDTQAGRQAGRQAGVSGRGGSACWEGPPSYPSAPNCYTI